MKFIYLLLVILLTGCSCIKETGYPSNIKMEDEIANLVESITHAKTYSPGMGSGDNFIYLVPLGIPLSITDIITLQKPGDQLFSSLEALDKLYLFSQLIDKLFVCDSIAHVSTKRLEDFNFEDKDLFKLTSPTYNGSFLQSATYPIIPDTFVVWSSFKQQLEHTDTLKIRGEKNYISIPHIKSTGDFTIIYIFRPWFQSNIVTTSLNSRFQKTAIIEGIILAKDFNIELMNKVSKVKVYKYRKKYRIIENPTSTTILFPNVIIGFYCRIL